MAEPNSHAAQFLTMGKSGADRVLARVVNRVIRRIQNRVVDFPEAVSGQTELNRLLRRVLNRVVQLPRADHGEFALLEQVRFRHENRVLGNPGLADATVDGKIQNANAFDYTIQGQAYTKAATDNLWDLTAFTPDVGAAEYEAVVLYLDASGTATTAKLALAASAAAAIALVEAEIVANATKCCVGVYVAGNSCDWNGAAGLGAQGTYYNGLPAAMTTAAVTAETDTILGNGGTAGYIALKERILYANAGQVYTKAATDDLWNLSTLVDVGGAKYRAVALCLDGGVASTVEGTDQDSAAAALAEVAALEPAGKCVVGYFVGGNSCDWDDGGGLAGQGTYYQSPPESTTISEATVAGTAMLGDGASAGFFKVSNPITFKVDGESYSKAATNDAIDLSTLTDVGASSYRAVIIWINAAGTLSYTEGEDKSTAALALADVKDSLYAATSKAVLGVYVAGNSCDWDNVAGLESQGTLHQGIPSELTIEEITVL